MSCSDELLKRADNWQRSDDDCVSAGQLIEGLAAALRRAETNGKRQKAAIGVALEFLRDRADYADDTGPSKEMSVLSEMTGILEGYYPIPAPPATGGEG